jgi:hypothetical protein
VGFTSGTEDVTSDPVKLCVIGESGVRVRNTGDTRVLLGGPGVGAGGYPLEPGESEEFHGTQHRPAGVVPSPAGDAAPDELWARADGDGPGRVSWIGA